MATDLERKLHEERMATLRFLEKSASSDLEAILLAVVEQAIWISLHISDNPRLRRQIESWSLERALNAFSALGEDGEEQAQR